MIEVVFDLPASNLGGTSEKQSKFAEYCVKLKSLKEKQHRQFCHASLAEDHKETCKTTHNHLSHNNYRNIELRHSFHQIDSLALIRASINQLPGSS